MKKLDEIMELMADEMADFKNNIDKLHKLNANMERKIITINTIQFEKYLEKLKELQKEYLFLQAGKIETINKSLQKSRIILASFVKIFGLIVIILLIVIGYLLYYYNKT